MEDKIKKYLNDIFAGKVINSQLIEDRQNLKKVLLEKIDECRAENIDEELLFEEALARLPEELPARLAAIENKTDFLNDTISSINYALFAKVFIIATLVIAEACYIIFSWTTGLWLKLAPLAFLPVFTAIGVIAGKRLSWNFRKNRHRLSPTLFTCLFACLVFSILYFLYTAPIAVADFYIISIAALAAIPLAQQIFSKVFLKKTALLSSLVFVILLAALFYAIVRRYLPDFKLIWLLFVAAAVIDGVIIFANLPLKERK